MLMDDDASLSLKSVSARVADLQLNPSAGSVQVQGFSWAEKVCCDEDMGIRNAACWDEAELGVIRDLGTQRPTKLLTFIDWIF